MAFFTTQRKETGSYNDQAELSHAVADAKAKYIMRKRKMAN